MNIEIKKLTPELAEEYVRFFDETPHDTKVDENKCYCVTWRSDNSYIADERHWFDIREERREKALKFVKNGDIQGYLAYCDGKVVGWCNANSNCNKCIDYLRLFYPIDENRENVKIKSIFCFVIAPEMQRKGIATKFVERVCRDAAEDGFDFVEAYVNKEFPDPVREFMGLQAMYEKCGFSVYAEQNGKIVMRKALKMPIKIIENRDESAYETSTITRVGCRGIVIRNSKMLICHELNSDDYYLIPGGGLKKNETLEECCIREVEEETGYVVKPIRHFLTLKEYYEEYEYIGHYYICDVIGEAQQKLTAIEAERGVTPEWISPDKILEIFSEYEKYAETNETKRRLYLRDFTALSEYFSEFI